MDTIMAADGGTKLLYSRAREALKELTTSRNWHHWLTIGEALVCARTEALARSRCNDMKPHRAKLAMAEVLREEGLDEIDPPTRSHILEVMDNLPDIDAWRKLLTPFRQATWNFPRTVLTHWKADMAKKAKAEREARGETKPSQRITMQDQITKLTEELDAANRLKTRGVLPPGWSAEDLVDHIADQHNAKFLRRMAEMAIKRAEAMERQDRIERNAKRPSQAKGAVS